MNAESTRGALVTCSRCGAPVPLLAGGAARCFYCLNEQALPTVIVSPLQTRVALANQLEGLANAAARFQHDSSVGSRTSLIFLIVLVSFALLSTATMLPFGRRDSTSSGAAPSLQSALFVVIPIGALIPFLAVPLAWIITQRRARVRAMRVMAGLPLSVPVVGETLSAACPRCGAPLDSSSGSSVVSKCRNCQADSLLPLPLVGVRLWKLHQQVILARLRGDTERDAPMAGIREYQKTAVPIILALCAVFVVAIYLFVLAIGWKHEHP
jgi:hypothetical protein